MAAPLAGAVASFVRQTLLLRCSAWPESATVFCLSA